MSIENLCAVVNNCLPMLKDARSGKAINHDLVDKFQEKIKDALNSAGLGYSWEIEKKAKGRSERDSIDILGRAKNNPNWIIEIDATRSDQVSQKLLSRIALWGLKEPIQYVAILYPDTQKGKSACEKYLRYGNEILRKINHDSSVVGIFVDPKNNTIEVLQFNLKNNDHFDVNGIDCISMSDAASEAIKIYLTKRTISYKKLAQRWGRYVLDQRGSSRYKNTYMRTTDGVTVHTYTQFRQYGLCSYWPDFVKISKNNGIKITKKRKFYIGGPTPYKYEI